METALLIFIYVTRVTLPFPLLSHTYEACRGQSCCCCCHFCKKVICLTPEYWCWWKQSWFTLCFTHLCKVCFKFAFSLLERHLMTLWRLHCWQFYWEQGSSSSLTEEQRTALQAFLWPALAWVWWNTVHCWRASIVGPRTARKKPRAFTNSCSTGSEEIWFAHIWCDRQSIRPITF